MDQVDILHAIRKAGRSNDSLWIKSHWHDCMNIKARDCSKRRALCRKSNKYSKPTQNFNKPFHTEGYPKEAVLCHLWAEQFDVQWGWSVLMYDIIILLFIFEQFHTLYTLFNYQRLIHISSAMSNRTHQIYNIRYAKKRPSFFSTRELNQVLFNAQYGNTQNKIMTRKYFFPR
jgi:hypothetical protein